MFQQRPSTAWGTRAQVTTPVLAARAFFGRAQHTSNLGLLDIPGWENMPLTEAAAKVQRPRADLRGAYAKWEAVAGDIADILGGDLPEGTSTNSVSDLAQCQTGDVAAITIGTLNLLGAGHTSGPDRRRGFAGWANRLPRAMSTLQNASVSIAALQEVHPPQGRALATRYSQQWGMYPANGSTQNVVVWDRSAWTATNHRMVNIPYFGGLNPDADGAAHLHDHRPVAMGVEHPQPRHVSATPSGTGRRRCAGSWPQCDSSPRGRPRPC